MKQYSEKEIQSISSRIKRDFYKPLKSYRTTVFLCGAGLDQRNNLRYKVNKYFNEFPLNLHYSIIFPEDLFEDLLYSKKNDLLSLENILANSVDAVVVIPESPGSFGELGAFVNNKELIDKTICFNHEEYKKQKNFLNDGPIKQLRKTNNRQVVYYNEKKEPESLKNLKYSINWVAKHKRREKENITLLELDDFLMPSIYLLEEVKKETLRSLVKEVINDSSEADTYTDTALSFLTKKRKIEATTNGYKLTNFGYQSFFELKRARKKEKYHKEKISLDNLRLEIMNNKFRGKKLDVEGE